MPVPKDLYVLLVFCTTAFALPGKYDYGDHQVDPYDPAYTRGGYEKGKYFHEYGTEGYQGNDYKATHPPYDHEYNTPPPYKEEYNTPPPYKEEYNTPPPYKEEYNTPPPYKEEYNTPPPYEKEYNTPPPYEKPTPYAYKTEAPRTYPTPHKYQTVPTYKHLPVTYPTTRKVLFSWTAWSKWFGCSVTCGVGIKKRTRECLKGDSNGKPDHNSQRYARDLGYFGGYEQPGDSGDFGGVFSKYSAGQQPIYDDADFDYEPGRDATGTDYTPLQDCEGDAVQIKECSSKPCPIDGGWSSWSLWSQCSATCGDGGIQTRTRECSRPAPAHGGKLCIGVFQETTICSHPRPCPIDGQWSEWSVWCRCSVSCGFGGIKTRGRNCTAPAPEFGGKACQGAAVGTKGCCEGPCPTHGKWSRWSEWSEPAQTCGAGGRVERTRRCDNPAPADGGEPCRGRDTDRKQVFLAPCPIDGCWSAWGDWSKSSASCGEDGFQTRSRTCDGPAPQYDGKDCIGDATQVQVVKTKPCPVDGGWSHWFDWTKCSASCGFEGTQIRKRSCTKPAPAHDGRTCEGPRGERRSCFLAFCAIDGHWGEWSIWSYGNATCGTGGTKTRSRSCDSPSAQYGGKTCEGDALEHSVVELAPCPLDGGWAGWSEWTRPLDTCGEHGGVSTRSRTCTNPKPAFGGANCRGHNFDTRLVKLPACPVCGGWSAWSEWAYCSATCGFHGTTTRHRQCNDPEPLNGGDQCEGEASQSKDCSAPPCPICGGWSHWSAWSACSASCGEGGLVTRRRSCDSPAPEFGGAPCEGEGAQKRVCRGAPCPINGAWSAWGSWTRPSVTCGEGLYPSRTRACNNPAPSYGGAFCRGPATSYRNVTTRPCPIDGGWSVWTAWSSSSITCGYGVALTRKRSCSSPEPAFHGRRCYGPSVDSKSAFIRPCPVDGAWGEWSEYSECSVTCGRGGYKFRQRPCSHPVPAYEGRFCVGKGSEVVDCSGHRPCSVDGQWGVWSEWSEGSASCGPDNVVTRSRNCDSPSPSYGGRPCKGESTSSKNLPLILCPIHGGFTEWTEWSTCSVKCGDGGIATRSRCCANPEPQYGGNRCEGKIKDTKSCSGPPCGINGGWAEWSAWSRCSVSCGEGGIVSRTRTCTRPAPTFGGKNCQGSSTEYAPGIAPPCPIDGGWGSWVAWSKCSVTCGPGGESVRSRLCNEPVAEYGGKECVGKKDEKRFCAQKPCPIDGGWGDWSEWSKPNVIYAIYGTEIYVKRTRLCDNPEPQYNGKPCIGDSTENKKITLPKPPLNGGWSSWSRWSRPTATCGAAVMFKARRCNNPTPSKDGHKCLGEAVIVKKVELKPCPIDGNWGLWCEWAQCSVTCGAGGTSSRSRLCNEPKPLFGGKSCRGDDFQTKHCYVKPCEVDGGWTTWGQWSTCSASCAEGTATRTRTCQNPETAHGGRPCEGIDKETKKCHLRPCDIDGNWNAWSEWAECSVTCGKDGVTSRNRKCNNPAPKYFGKNCIGSHTESKNCSAKPCSIDGGWGAWAEWSSCSKSCGYGGSTSRNRVCDSPKAAFGGRPCQGDASQVKYCFNEPCNNWSPWTHWSGCVEKCGIKPYKERNRQCLLQNNLVYGKNIIEYCEGKAVDFEYCDKEVTHWKHATPYTLQVPGYGEVKGACVNNFFVLFSRTSKQLDMHQDWLTYKKGFGTQPDNFYVGNEASHKLTTSGKYYDFTEVVTKKHQYHNFLLPKILLESESRDYALHLGDSVTGMTDGTPFSTYDRDNDKSAYTNCAQVHLGGWWYDNCYKNHNLFGEYTKYFEMKDLTPDQYLIKARFGVQRLPTEDDVEIKPYTPPKYPPKPVYPPKPSLDYYNVPTYKQPTHDYQPTYEDTKYQQPYEQHKDAYTPPPYEQQHKDAYTPPPYEQQHKDAYTPPPYEQQHKDAYTPPHYEQQHKDAYTPPPYEQQHKDAYTPPPYEQQHKDAYKESSYDNTFEEYREEPYGQRYDEPKGHQYEDKSYDHQYGDFDHKAYW